jgi:hypothetical protein
MARLRASGGRLRQLDLAQLRELACELLEVPGVDGDEHGVKERKNALVVPSTGENRAPLSPSHHNKQNQSQQGRNRLQRL